MSRRAVVKQLADKLAKLAVYADFSALIKQQSDAVLSQHLQVVLKHYVRLRQPGGQLPTRGAFFFKCQAAKSMIAALDKSDSPKTLTFPSFKVQAMVQDGLMGHLFRLFKEKFPACRIKIRESVAANERMEASPESTDALISQALAIAAEALIGEVLDERDRVSGPTLFAEMGTVSEVSTISTSDSEGTVSTLSTDSSGSLDESDLSGDDSSVELEYSSSDDEVERMTWQNQNHSVSI